MTPNTDLPPPSMVIYDWDNTLVDTWPVIHAAMNSLFRQMQMTEWTLEETRNRVKHSMRDSFPILFGDRWEEARDLFYQAFEAVHLQNLTPATGADDLLSHFKTHAIPQAIVSNKQGQYLRTEAAHLNWQHFFHALAGAGDTTRDKPSPDPVHHVLQGLEIAPGPSIYFLGDTSVDMEIAHATGLTPVLIHPNPDMQGEFSGFPPRLHFASLAEFHRFIS